MQACPARSLLFLEVNKLDKQILVAEEVAEILRVGTQRVYELCRTDPTFPVIRVGERQYRFAADAVRRWLEAGGSHVVGGRNA